jgi:hypothetical protein
VARARIELATTIFSRVLYGIGEGSGVELTVPFVHLLKFRNRKLVQLRGYADRGEALKAAGLSE